jgi:hypothetical protein
MYPMLRHQVESDAAGTVGQGPDVGIFVRPDNRSLDLKGLLGGVHRIHPELADKVALHLRDSRPRTKGVRQGRTVELNGNLNLPAAVMMDAMTMLEPEFLAMDLKDLHIPVLFEEDDGFIDHAAAPTKLFYEKDQGGSLWEPHETGFTTLSLDENINFCCHGIYLLWRVVPDA